MELWALGSQRTGLPIADSAGTMLAARSIEQWMTTEVGAIARLTLKQ
jgi:hypothetical protein